MDIDEDGYYIFITQNTFTGDLNSLNYCNTAFSAADMMLNTGNKMYADVKAANPRISNRNKQLTCDFGYFGK